MTRRNPVADLRGASRLAVEATTGVAEVAEAMHRGIARIPLLDPRPPARARGVAGLVYGSVRGVARLVGGAVEGLLSGLAPLSGEVPAPRGWEEALAVLNGVVGDHLAASGNPLALPMELRRGGRALVLDRRRLAAAIRRPSRRLLVLVHGSCRDDLGWRRGGHDHGRALARDLGCTALHLRYNTGLHVSENGLLLAALLETLLAEWPAPVEELAILAHSMGGLVARSACHQGAEAGHHWPGKLRALVCLGTPHHGAGLERAGNLLHLLLGVSPYSAPLARLARIRSAGVTDLRHGSLLEEDWKGRSRFAHGPDRRRPVPLPRGTRCYAVAASTAPPGASPRRLPGDGLVPVESALGRHRDPARALRFPAARTFVVRGAGHLDLLDRPEVYARIRGWLGSGPGPGKASQARPRRP